MSLPYKHRIEVGPWFEVGERIHGTAAQSRLTKKMSLKVVNEVLIVYMFMSLFVFPVVVIARFTLALLLKITMKYLMNISAMSDNLSLPTLIKNKHNHPLPFTLAEELR